VNRQLRRLSLVSVLMLVVLVGATTYWQAWAAGGLQDKQDNAIERVVQFSIERGLIVPESGKAIYAANRRKRVSGQTLFFRRYPTLGLAAQTVGYSTASHSQAGLEQSMNDYLTGSNTNLSNALQRTLDRLGGGTVKGNKLVLTLDTSAQNLAMKELGSQCGAVVAMDVKTGAVLVLASKPTYNPNLIDEPGGYEKVLKIRGSCGEGAALENRATAGLYTPGSTFKMITAAAALDTGKFKPTSPFYDPGYCIDYGKPVSNAGNPDQGGTEVFGHVDLAEGFQHSINSVFCNVGKALGARVILDYAKRFGFYSVPPLETPADERAASGLYVYTKKGRVLYDPADQNLVDAGRLGFGQERMLVTPLQMAMVGATIANGGVVPRPYVVQRIVGPDGSIVRDTKSSTLGRAIKPTTAAELTQMMVSVVQAGTGTAAQIPGVQVAGKTGTAETGVPNVYTAWFVCFAPADNPRFAVAVVLEKQLNGFGGVVSAPIAKAVLENLLHG
jgi:penicillin-binding protein A